MEKVTPHPRPFASEADLARLRVEPEMPAMVQAHGDLIRNARKYVRSSKLTGWGAGQDPSGLGTAREMIDRVETPEISRVESRMHSYHVEQCNNAPADETVHPTTRTSS